MKTGKGIKRLLAIVSCLAIAVAYMPASTWALTMVGGVGTIDESSGEEIFKELTDLGAPEGYNQDAKKHPYGYGNEPTSTLRNSRLMLASSAHRSSGGNSKSYWTLKGYKKGGEPIYKDTADSWTEKKISENGDRMDEYAYIQAVSFDPDGDGLRDIVAYIGINTTENNKYKVGVWTLNTNTGLLENNETFLGSAGWVVGDGGSRSPTDSMGRNFVSITAGDYDADGKDTLFAYACLDGDDYGLFELTYANGKLQKQNTTGSKDLLNPAYNDATDIHNAGGAGYAGFKLKGSLTTGDLNNDGIDDLVVTSATGAANTTIDQQARETYVAVALGEDSLDGSLAQKSDASLYINDNGTSITSSRADIGNIFNDGYNKLTVAGRMIKKDDSGAYQQYYKVGNVYSSKTAVFFYELKNGKLQQRSSMLDIDSPYEDSTNYPCLDPVALCSAYVDGYGHQEQLFINGRIYKFEEDGSIKCLCNDFDTNSGYAYLFEAVPVTVDDNNYGIEQFAVSYLGNTPSSFGTSTAKCAITYGNASYDADGKLTPTTSYKTDTGSPFDRDGDGFFEGATNMLMVPYENKVSDVMLMKLNHKGYFYSNPEPVAVLQAAPYFKETGSGNAGTTQYSLTASYTKGTGTTTNSSIGGGFAETFTGGSLIRQTFSVNYKTLVSEDFKQSVRESFTTTFTAAAKDTVVIQSTPVVYYSYDVYNETSGKWEENQMGLTIAQIPLYTQITVDQYNDFAEYYNTYSDEHEVKYTYGGEEKTVKSEHLNQIDKGTYYLGNSGNPSGYSHVWSNLPNGKRASKGSMALGYQGGSTTNNYGYETSETKTHTKGWSVDEALNIQLGGNLSKLIGLWVGGTINHSKGSSSCTFETTGNGYSISGTVKNLDADALTKSGQFPENSVKAYNFQWTFGLSDFTAHGQTSDENADANIPVACYVVDNVTRGLPSPSLKTLTETENQKLSLTWAAPSTDAGQTIEGYIVYHGDINGNYTKVTETPLSADTLTYEYTAGSKINQHSFVITAVGKATATQQKSIESLPSNAKSIIFDPGKQDVTVEVKDKTLTYGDELEMTEDDLVFPDGIDKSLIDMDSLQWSCTYTKGSPAGRYNVSAKGLKSENYTFSYEAGLVTVNPIELTEENLTATAKDKVYDGNATATGSITVSSGLLGTDSVKVTFDSAEFEDAKVGKDKTVTFSGLELAGTKAADYKLTADTITAKAAITKGGVSVWASAGTEQKYTGKVKGITASSSPKCNTQVAYYGIDENGLVGSKVDGPKDAGDYMYVITLPEDSPYVISDALPSDEAEFVGKPYDSLDASNIGIMTITKAEAEIGVNDKTITYGDEAGLSASDLILPEGVDSSQFNTDKLGWTTTYTPGSNTGAYTVKAKGITSKNYKLTYEQGIITVKEKALDQSNLEATAKDKVYDGTTDAAGTIIVKSGLFGSDSLQVNYTAAAFADANVGMDKTVTFSDLYLSGAKAGNYTLDADTITARAAITKAEAVVWASEGTSHLYDGTAKGIVVSSIPDCETQVAYYTLDENMIIGNRVDAPVDLGNYMYVITIAEGSPYEVKNALPSDEAEFIGKPYDSLVASNIGIMNIAINVQPELGFENPIIEKTYGDGTFSQQAIGGIEGATIQYEVAGDSDCITVDAATGQVTIAKPGTAVIKATAVAPGCEDISASYVVNVSKKLVKITMAANTELAYTGETLDKPYKVSGDVAGNRIAAEDITFTYTNTANLKSHSHKNAGEYYVTARIPVTNEYYMTDGEATGILTITAKAVTVKPDSGQSKKYGQYDPEFTYTVKGLAEGDLLKGKLSRTKGEKSGKYDYTLGTLHNDNYQLTLAENAPKFTIQAAPVYYVPRCRVVASGNDRKVSWDKITGADGYMVYAAYCDGSFDKPFKTVSSGTSSILITKLNGKSINQKKCIKVKIVAYKLKSGKKTTYKKSLTAHLPGKYNSKHTGAKSLTITSGTEVALKVGKSSKIKATTTRINSAKSLLATSHCATYRYASTAKYIATVDANGVITATGKGRCYIYVYAQNGISTKIKVTVK